MMTELLYSNNENSAGGSRPREGINSSSFRAYEDSELDGEASANSAHPSGPVAADRGEPAVEQPEPSATQEPPIAQTELSAT